ncbi:MAG: response regulator [Candidatus Paceibacterota bacterium]
MKILLVDDDVFLRDMYATKFLDSGHEVDTADGGPSALTFLNSGVSYDLILLDMIMPGTSGVDLLQLMKEKFPNQIKNAIFLSNQGQDEDKKEAKSAGAVGYIVKADMIPSEVVKKVEEIVEKNS